MIKKIKRNMHHKQESAGGFPLNENDMPLDRNGRNALKSTYSSKKSKDKLKSK